MDKITPRDKAHWLELRMQDVTSSEVAALFNLSPWITKFELWHRKKNKEVVSVEDNERIRWGNRLEEAIAHGIADDQGWTVHPFKDYARIPGMRLGSSFDFLMFNGEKEGLLEIKNVDSLQLKDKWVIEGGQVVEAPPHIEIQCQHQMMVSGHDYLYIGALVGGNTVKLIKRRPNNKIIKKIKTEAGKFWTSIDEDNPPRPDFLRDARFISELYNYSEPGKLLETEDMEIKRLVDKYKSFGDLIKEAKEKKDATKAKILMKIGDAEKVISDSYSISSRMIGPKTVTYEAKGYRDFRIHIKKEK